MKKYNLLVLLLMVVGIPLWAGAQTYLDNNQYVQRGQQLYMRDSTARAIQLFDSALLYYPKNSRAFELRSRAKIKLGDIKGGITDLDSAILYANEQQKQFLFSKKELAIKNAREKSGYTDAQTLEVYNASIASSPNSDKGYSDRSRYYAKMGKFQEAFADADMAIKLNPTPQNFTNLTSIMQQTGENSNGEILKVYDYSIKESTEKSMSYHDRGQYYENLTYRTRSVLDNSMPQSEEEKVMFHRKALKDIDKAIELAPSKTFFYLARIQWKINSQLFTDKEILSDFDDYIGRMQSKSSAYWERATVYFARQKRFKEAIADLDTAISLNPKSFLYYFKRASYKDQQGTYSNSDIRADLDKMNSLMQSKTTGIATFEEYKTLMRTYGGAKNDND